LVTVKNVAIIRKAGNPQEYPTRICMKARHGRKVTEALGGAGLLESNFLADDGVYFGIIASTS
jgi:hypothetical protein